MPTAQSEGKKKFPGLFGGGDEGDDEAAEDMPDDEAAEGDDAAPDEGDGYDLTACANDIMAAVKANDVDALKEALQELVDKVKA